jgi:hypothetical protein
MLKEFLGMASSPGRGTRVKLAIPVVEAPSG